MNHTHKILLIAMDLDGTALQADRCSFSPKLTAVLKEAHNRGVIIVPVTGRQFGLLPPAMAQLPDRDTLAVLCNGGQIRRLGTGELLFSRMLSPQALLGLHAMALELGIPLEFSRDSRLHLTRKDYEAQLPVGGLGFHVDTILKTAGVIVPSLLPLCREDTVEKAQLPHIPKALHRQVLQRLQTLDLAAVWSSDSSMEITHREATKGNALARLGSLLNIPPQAMLAIGDSGNDISMLRYAGIGVAMGNAPDAVKAAADAVTEDSRRDGAALAIEQFVLQNL